MSAPEPAVFTLIFRGPDAGLAGPRVLLNGVPLARVYAVKILPFRECVVGTLADPPRVVVGEDGSERCAVEWRKGTYEVRP